MKKSLFVWYLVDKKVWAAIIGNNEAVALDRVEPFDLACKRSR